jgi:hypothetical protein
MNSVKMSTNTAFPQNFQALQPMRLIKIIFSATNRTCSYAFTVLFCLTLLSCNKDDQVYNACLKRFQYENLIPSTRSLEWIPYGENQVLLFSNDKGSIIKLIRKSYNEVNESLKSFIQIPCPNDSLQTAYIDYSTLEYQNIFVVAEGNTTLTEIDMNVDVILDEKHSNLDDAKLADILKLNFKFKKSSQVELNQKVLEFPILDRGYTDALALAYLFYSSVILHSKSYSEVYTNYENEEQIKAYYSINGLLGFEIQGDLFVKIN